MSLSGNSQRNSKIKIFNQYNYFPEWKNDVHCYLAHHRQCDPYRVYGFCNHRGYIWAKHCTSANLTRPWMSAAKIESKYTEHQVYLFRRGLADGGAPETDTHEGNFRYHQ
jgi:hypothetical protein